MDVEVKFSDEFVSDILALLDRIEIEEDSALAGQRFDIAEKHGMTVHFEDEFMDFSEALLLIRQGKLLARKGWNGPDQFVFLVPGSRFVVDRAPLLGIYPEGTEVEYSAHIDIRNAQGTIVPWFASQGDLLAQDWVEVDAQ